MIHRKEWYTCDRCGEDIDKTPSEALYKNFVFRKKCSPQELQILTVDRYGYIAENFLKIPEVVSAEIVEGYLENRKTIHLCGKCRKNFERFMKNE